MHKTLVGTGVIFMLLLTAILPAYAQTVTVTPSPSSVPTHREIRHDIKQDENDLQKDKTALKETTHANNLVHLMNATVTAVNGNTLTVTDNSKTYTVTVGSTTKLRRHFWGSSDLTEIAVNDKVAVWGKYTDTNQTTIAASLVRDLSIMKRHGVFFGTVSSLTSTGFIFQPEKRGTQTVTTGTTTKFVNRKEQTIQLSDVKVGDKLRVRGIWDKTNGTITGVTEVKDFSLPTRQPSVTPTQTPTPTP